ncbi:MAG: alpha-amylase family glycosyl hydrolase, partial [Bacteroidota bacterium]
MKRLLLVCTAVFCVFQINAQLLTWSPSFPKEADAAQTFVITADATKGNTGLVSYTPVTDVYVHIGVITNLSANADDWKYVSSVWASTTAAYNAPSAGANKWSFTINGSLRTFFGIVNSSETIQKIAILFRNGNGTRALRNADGGNMYVPIYSNALAVRIDQPFREPKFIPTPENPAWTVGTAFTVNAKSNSNAALKLYHNGTQIVAAANAQSITGNSTVTATGLQQIVAEANDGTTVRYDTMNINVTASTPVAPLPAGAQDGINYLPGNASVTLVLRAPGKANVFVLGDFNNWTQSNPYQMNKTPDGNFFWVTVSGLTAGTEYGFQYLVDGSVKIADPYAEKILDPFNDGFISAATYPGLKPYPAGQTGMVGVLQTAQPTYNWAVNSFSQPSQKGLVIYELLLRDFLAAHDYKALKDTLSYLKRLGINAIQLMPVTEFEGNNSWGYNTFQYFAPDKYYGTKNGLKEFIDSCHKNGIAVIMDIVLNHTYGPSPLKDLYGLVNNPWYNSTAPHTAISFGDDFNHESIHTKYFFNRVIQHWLTEYKMDGYRIDFSKGLTQKSSASDGAMSAYDASRIAIIKGYQNTAKAVDADAYIILEHFADNTEEKELADAGMMLWSNVWTQYQEASMGYLPNSNLDNGVYTSRGWTNPHLVTFMESHDEERITFKNIKYGNSSGSYNVKDTATALKRMELNAAFLLGIPGPKMIWQFGELGYDYSRCYLSTNGEGGDCDKKLDPKPIRWDYLQVPERKQLH